VSLFKGTVIPNELKRDHINYKKGACDSLFNK